MHVTLPIPSHLISSPLISFCLVLSHSVSTVPRNRVYSYKWRTGPGRQSGSLSFSSFSHFGPPIIVPPVFLVFRFQRVGTEGKQAGRGSRLHVGPDAVLPCNTRPPPCPSTLIRPAVCCVCIANTPDGARWTTIIIIIMLSILWFVSNSKQGGRKQYDSLTPFRRESCGLGG